MQTGEFFARGGSQDPTIAELKGRMQRHNKEGNGAKETPLSPVCRVGQTNTRQKSILLEEDPRIQLSRMEGKDAMQK